MIDVSRAVAPGGRFHLVGHDWGGIQGWEFATAPRFDGTLASFTSIAGPALDQLIGSIAAATRRGRLPDVIERIRRSWYVFVLCTPGGPTLIWRGVMGGGRWRTWLRYVERVPGDVDFPRRSVSADGLHGSTCTAATSSAGCSARATPPARASRFS